MPTTKTDAPTKVVTGKVRLSYVHVFEPHSFDSAPDKSQYSVCVIVRKDDEKTLEKISAALEQAKAYGKVSKWSNKLPPKLWIPLRDGDVDRPDDPAFKGCFFLNAKSNAKPGVVDRDLNPILDQDEIYSGVYARVSLSFFPYANSGSFGIGVGLNNIQKWADGERLSSRATPDEDFDEKIDEEDDLLG